MVATRFLFVVVFAIALVHTVTAQGCLNFTSCKDCSSSSECVWCNTQSSCKPGNYLGPTDASTCQDWSWEQCLANGNTVIYIAVGVGGGLILILVIVIWCYCARCQAKRRKRLMDDYDKLFDETKPKKETGPSRWQQRREDLYAKYDFLKKKDGHADDEDENM